MNSLVPLSSLDRPNRDDSKGFQEYFTVPFELILFNHFDGNDVDIPEEKADTESTISGVDDLGRKLFDLHSALHLNISSDIGQAIDAFDDRADVVSNDDEIKMDEDTARSSPSMLRFDSWVLKTALKSLEFEIESEILKKPIDDFSDKEFRSSSCARQFCTISIVILLLQVAVLTAMIQIDGLAPKSVNPLMGPPVETLVRFGAKEAGLIVEHHQWWRLVSAVMLHAGLLHILSNVFIQLRVGGYLVLVFGWRQFLWIYFASGIFGNMMSCIFLVDTVGVGSSGALMGMLSAWVVWIIFRWQKIPSKYKAQRNCQLLMVIASIVATLAMSFAPYTDWCAHFGGTVQGILWGILLLSKELQSRWSRVVVRLVAGFLAVATYAYAIYYMTQVLVPDRAETAYFQQNDDWGHHWKQKHSLRPPAD